jgi:Ca2+-binding EF-hand superfamily protein
MKNVAFLLAFSFAVGGLGGLGGLAQGQQQQTPLGRLTPEEFIKRFDKNGDGFLTRDELPANLAAAFDRIDTNKDGKISRSEAQGQLAQNFDRFDTNKDGFLDRAELLAVARRMAAGPAGARPGSGPGAGAEPVRNAVDFDALDKNADGRLTREELRGTPYFDKFDEIDTNKDGKIDPREFAAYLKKQSKGK